MIDLSNENMIHIKRGNIEYLQFRRLLQYDDKIAHCYSLKGNGNDYQDYIGDNFKLLCDELDLDYNKFKRIDHQIHGNEVDVVDDIEKTYTNVDGLLTDLQGVSLSLRFADCTPIFLYDPTKNVIGNLHSGWKGTVKKIALKGAKKMMEVYGCNKENIICCIGPCIGKCHFEVSEDVKEIFSKTFGYMLSEDEFISKGDIKEGVQKYYIDTNIINVKLLEEAGIRKENIVVSNICTVCNCEQMHSYRVDKEKAGRNTSIIGIRG